MKGGLRRVVNEAFEKALRLGRPEVLAGECVSWLGGRSARWPTRLLNWAEEGGIDFSIRWPSGYSSAARHFRLQLFGCHLPACSPFARETPASPATLFRVPLPASAWRTETIAGERLTSVRVRLNPAALAGFNGLLLEIGAADRERCWERLGVELLEEAGAQRLRVDELRAETRQLWIQSGDCLYPGNLVPETSELLFGEFSLRSSARGAVLPPLPGRLDWSLATGKELILLASEQVVLGPGAIHLRSPGISAQLPAYFPRPGEYSLRASINGREVAAFPFTVLSREDLLARVKVLNLELAATATDGRVRLQKDALHWGAHVSFQPILQIETAVPAPNQPVRCTARLTQAGKVLRSEELILALDRRIQRLPLRSFVLRELRAAARARPARLTLTVRLQGLLKGSWPIIILPSERLTNFEGQLKCPAADLPVDEEAYQEILARLVPDPPPRPKSLWHIWGGRPT